LSRQCQKSRKETIVEKDMESCQMEAVMIPNSSPKEAMVQEQVIEKAVASKAGNEDVENAKMDTSTTPAVEIDLTQPEEEIAKMDTVVQPVISLNHNEYKKKVTFLDQVRKFHTQGEQQ
jgi:hypothetical protein